MSTAVKAIGLYIACSSLLLLIFILVDVLQVLIRSAGKRRRWWFRRWWFPCRWMSINAATLSVMAVAVKLPNDITTPMGGGVDQLSKLSGVAMVAAVMGFALPSVGNVIHKDMDTVKGDITLQEMKGNLVGLGVLVVTVVVNECTQMSTGVISRIFLVEHVLVLISMLLTFALLCTAAVGTYSTSEMLSMQVDGRLPREPSAKWDEMEKVTKQAALLARTGSKDYVTARSHAGLAMGATLSLSTLTLLGAIIRAARIPDYFVTQSDYGWTLWPVLILQILIILLSCTIACIRWWRPIIFKEMKSIGALTNCWQVEEYMHLELIKYKRRSKHHHSSTIWRLRSMLITILLCLHDMIVRMSKLVCMLSQIFCYCFRLGISESPLIDDGQQVVCLDDGQHVVCLQHEDPHGLWISNKSLIKSSKHNPTPHLVPVQELVDLLTRFASPAPFKSLQELDSLSVPKLQSDNLSSIGTTTWSLAAATLLTIMFELKDFFKRDIGMITAQKALEAYKQASDLIRMVESPASDLSSAAAEYVLGGLNRDQTWLNNIKRHRCSLLGECNDRPADYECVMKILQDLRDIGVEIADQTYNDTDFVACSAANSLYRMSALLERDLESGGCLQTLLCLVLTKLANVIGACLTNIPCAALECSKRHARYHDEDGCLEILTLVAKAKLIEGKWPPLLDETLPRDGDHLHLKTWMHAPNLASLHPCKIYGR